jgi:alpha-L-fucosidase
MYGDWYARHLYVEGHDQYRHHWRVYGHPSKVGYKDIVPLWKAEKFDPEGLMNLFVEAGAKYFFGQAMHHDNFDLFDSAHNPWNSVNIGPKKDIVGLWQKAAKAHGLPFGLSEHLGASFNWWAVNKLSDKVGPYAGIPYDGSDPAFSNLYYADNANPGGSSGYNFEWYTQNAAFHAHWFNRIKDVIDKYQPDLLYSDGGVPFGDIGLSIVAHLYNSSVKTKGRNLAVYNQKDASPDVYTIGVLDIERGGSQKIEEHPWQCDTSVGDWFYNVKDVYKSPREVLCTLTDIVSKNGNLVLNIPQLPDGTLDDECSYLLRRMALWMKSNSEGIFGSRPWEISGEGASSVEGGAFKESAVDWTDSDFRFTKKGDTIYAYQMKQSSLGSATIKSFALGHSRRVSAVRNLGKGPVNFEQTSEGLRLQYELSEDMESPIGFAINME